MPSVKPEDYTLEEFTSVVNQSFLSDEEKTELKSLAATQGISQELWTKFDDLLFVALQNRKRLELQYKSQLDSEIQRYTEEYESEKHTIDLKMRADLKRCERLSETEVQALWDQYYRRIGALQEKLLESVRRTSQTALQQVAAVAGGGK